MTPRKQCATVGVYKGGTLSIPDTPGGLREFENVPGTYTDTGVSS